MTKRAFIAVDVQYDFCEGGSLPVAGGNVVAERIAQHLAADETYDVVVATLDSHPPGGTPDGHFAAGGEDPNYSTSWPAHCVSSSPGWRLHEALDHVGFDFFAYKGQTSAAYSGFDSPGLADSLRDAGVEEVVVGGLALDYCVKATALDAARLGFKTTVQLDLTAPVAEATGLDAIVELRAAGVSVVQS
jgi:nicotinamidase/pyrazinamidase